jgi:hypothetical protein
MIERLNMGDYDCLWIASDRDGHVAAFMTAGVAPVPIHALENEHIEVSDIGNRLSALLPCVSSARLLVEMPRPDDFIALAERGLFAYDWSDVHRSESEEIRAYEMVATPLNPITVEALPDEIAFLLEGLWLDQVAFANTPLLDIRAHRICRAEGDVAGC